MSKATTALQIMQIANMGMATLFEFLGKKKSAPEAKITKAEIKAYILTSTRATELSGALIVNDRKGFDKAINKMVDSVEEILKKSEWK
jgi:hypothetical protein